MRHISFAGSAASLLEHGAVFNITLLPDPMVIREMAQRDEPIVSATVPMLLDTGADRTVVEQQVAEKMGLTPIRFAEMRGVNQKPELYPLYLKMLRLHVEDGLRAGAVDFRAEVVGCHHHRCLSRMWGYSAATSYASSISRTTGGQAELS